MKTRTHTPGKIKTPLLVETPCLVVGIGASAGGQAALEQLFTAIPPDCGITFVVIMHLPPEGRRFLPRCWAVTPPWRW